jgi:hypothetical protein
MSPFGKILAFLNVFGAIGFVCMGAMDYAKRQAWEHAVFQHDLLLKGLPLDAQETDPEGHSIAEAIGPQTQKELFPTGQPVTTQEAEVRNLQSRFQGLLDNESDPKKKMALTAQLLLPLATTNAERERLLAYRTHLWDPARADQLKKQFEQADRQAKIYIQGPPKDQPKKDYDEAFLDALAAQRPEPAGPLAERFLKIRKVNPARAFNDIYDEALERQALELKEQFEGAFQAALTAKRPGESPTAIPPDERRRAIAHLLFALLEVMPDQEPNPSGDLMSTGGFKRFVTVVGLKEAVREVNSQAAVLTRVASELDLARSRERGTFAVSHENLLRQLQDRAAQLEAETALWRRNEDQVADQEKLVAKRKRDVKQYEDELEQSRQVTAARLKELRDMTQALHAVRVQVRDALGKNAQYERDLRELEAGR